MIFTQADREAIQRLERNVIGLREDVGITPRNEDCSLQARLGLLRKTVNELGAALGRIESVLKLQAGARETERKVLDEIMSGHNSDRVLEFEDIKKTMNRRADEMLDTVRGRNDVTNNAIVALSGRVEIQREAILKLVDLVDQHEGRANGQFMEIQGKIDAIDAMFRNAVFAAIKKREQRKARRKKK